MLGFAQPVGQMKTPCSVTTARGFLITPDGYTDGARLIGQPVTVPWDHPLVDLNRLA